MSTRCPSCGFGDCYNSGFSIECWNRTCKFFTEKQYEAVQKLMESKRTPVGGWNPWTDEEEKRLMEVFSIKESKSTHVVSSSGSFAVPNANWTSHQNRKNKTVLTQKDVDDAMEKLKQLDLFSCDDDDDDNTNHVDYSGFLNDRGNDD